MSDLVSVITPTIKGREWFFERCCASVASQTYQPVEHVIDATEGIGPMPAFQRCLERATGEYVLPVADDDWIAPHAIETLLGALANGDVVFARMLIVSPGNDRLVNMGSAVMWRRRLTDEIGGYDPRWRHAGDTDLYARFVRSGASIGYCPEPLYFFTEHADHHSYVYRDELAVELREIHGLYPGVMSTLEALVA